MVAPPCTIAQSVLEVLFESGGMMMIDNRAHCAPLTPPY